MKRFQFLQRGAKKRCNRKSHALVVACLACVFSAPCGWADVIDGGGSNAVDLWSRENLVTWCVSPCDAAKQGTEDLAQTLERLGLKHVALISFADYDAAKLDTQIEALQSHGIEIAAASLASDADAAVTKRALELFKHHGAHPQIWVGFPEEDIPQTPVERQRRVAQESDRVQAVVDLARPYGVNVELYNPGGSPGMLDNEISLIKGLKSRGVDDVGMVYNLSHARENKYDDSKSFPSIWKTIQPYVVTINVAGPGSEGQYVYPSQDNNDLNMVRAIQASGWRGRIGVTAGKSGDVEAVLRNDILGLEWLAAELKRPGSGGPALFPPGFAIFQSHCAVCHDKGTAGAPASFLLTSRTTSSIYSALTTGRMRQQAAQLSNTDRRQVAEYLTGRSLSTAAELPPKMCGSDHAWFDARQAPVGVGWGIDAENTRTIPKGQARIGMKDLGALKLKWAFGFPDAVRSETQPLAAGGGLFVASQDGSVYALDARSGCVHWIYKAAAEIDGLIIHSERVPDGHRTAQQILFFGDRFGFVYALDATTGEFKWKVRVDEHPATEVIGTPVWWAGRLYVPVASSEEMSVPLQDYPCCTFRGSLVALNQTTGEVVWKRYTIPSPPGERFKNPRGVSQFGPSGAGLWRSPTIDQRRGSVYFTTGNGYSGPPR